MPTGTLSPALAPRPLPAHSLARVTVLFRGRCPANVARLVVAIIVDAIKGVFRGRAWADVLNEGVEGVAPFPAHLNPAGTVVLERSMLWRRAPLLGIVPCRVLWRSEPAVSFGALALAFALVAAAALRHALSEIARRNDSVVTAVAAALPLRGLRVCLRLSALHDGPTVEASPRQVFCLVLHRSAI